jgi:hypothetical protein
MEQDRASSVLMHYQNWRGKPLVSYQTAVAAAACRVNPGIEIGLQLLDCLIRSSCGMRRGTTRRARCDGSARHQVVRPARQLRPYSEMIIFTHVDQRLRRRVHLIVVSGSGEAGEFADIVSEPGSMRAEYGSILADGATTPRTRGDRDKVAGRSGFEPRLPGPEPGVPPLNYCPSASTRRAITMSRPGPATSAHARQFAAECRRLRRRDTAPNAISRVVNRRS